MELSYGLAGGALKVSTPVEITASHVVRIPGLTGRFCSWPSPIVNADSGRVAWLNSRGWIPATPLRCLGWALSSSLATTGVWRVNQPMGDEIPSPNSQALLIWNWKMNKLKSLHIEWKKYCITFVAKYLCTDTCGVICVCVYKCVHILSIGSHYCPRWLIV